MRTLTWFAFFLMVDVISGILFGIQRAVIEPQEPIVLLNNLLEMNCTANETSGLNASQLYWTASGVNVSAKSMQIIGERTLQFKKNITSISEFGTYECKNVDRTGEPAVQLKVEYAAVSNVTNFTCLFQKGALTCNWTLDKCRYPEFIDVKLRMSLNSNDYNECPMDLTYTTNSCTWIITKKTLSYRFQLFLQIENKVFGGKSNFTYEKDFDVTTPNVSSFMCILLEKAKTLSCNWTFEKFEFPEDVEVNFSVSPDKNKTFHTCPVALSYTSNSCTWKNITPSYRYDFYMEVRSKSFGGTMPYQKLFYKSEILKLQAPVNINYKSNGTCVFLDWNVDRYYSTNTSLSVTSLLNSSDIQTRMLYKINETVLCNLRPASSYIVTVQVIPVWGYHYSEQKRLSVTTLPIPPTEAPMVFPGGFSIDPHSKCNSDNAMRTVYIYWKRISKSSENGKNLSYEISYNGGNLTNISPDQSRTSIRVDCHVSYNIRILARNEAGPSATSSLFLDKHKDLMPPAKIIVEQMGDTRAFLTWYGIDKQASQYIAWCRKNVESECKDEIHYESWRNHTEITQDKVGSLITKIKFGITQQKNRTGSGIIWQTCTYDREKEPSKMENIEIVDTSSDNSIKVRWKSEHCTFRPGNVFIVLYRVFYCEVTINNECKAGTNQTIETYPGERPEFTISDLKMGIRYGISIQAASETKTGEISDMVIGSVTSRTMWKTKPEHRERDYRPSQIKKQTFSHNISQVPKRLELPATGEAYYDHYSRKRLEIEEGNLEIQRKRLKMRNRGWRLKKNVSKLNRNATKNL